MRKRRTLDDFFKSQPGTEASKAPSTSDDEPPRLSSAATQRQQLSVPAGCDRPIPQPPVLSSETVEATSKKTPTRKRRRVVASPSVTGPVCSTSENTLATDDTQPHIPLPLFSPEDPPVTVCEDAASEQALFEVQRNAKENDVQQKQRPPPDSVDHSMVLCDDEPFSTSALMRMYSQDVPTPVPVPRRSLTTAAATVLSAGTTGIATATTSGSPLLSAVTPPPSAAAITPRLESVREDQETEAAAPLRTTTTTATDDRHNDQHDAEDEENDHEHSKQTTLFVASTTLKSSTTTTTTGSLFGSFRVSASSQPVADLESPNFDPAAYVPEGANSGKPFTSLRFSVVASTFDSIESLKGSGPGSKKKASTLLANLFRVVLWHCPSDLIPVLYICLNKVGPEYLGLEVGIGDSTLIRVLMEVYGRSEKSIKTDLSKYEDLGRVAELSRCTTRTLFPPLPLTIRYVFEELKALATITGQQSQQKKKDKIKKLMVASQKSEGKYIIRFLQQRMRMGVQAATIYQALGFACVLTRPKSSVSSDTCAYSDLRRTPTSLPPSALTEMESAVRSALYEVSNIEVVAEHLLKGASAAELKEKCVVTAGIPVHPMLAKPTKGIQEVLQRFGDCDFTCEFKYDGERAQIHLCPDGTIAIFSRNLENLTPKYPDVAELCQQAFKKDTQSCILDCEIVAFDSEKQTILPFQVLSTRKRKGVETTVSVHNVTTAWILQNIHVGVCVFAFDCVLLNGESLLKKPFSERRECLYACTQEVAGRFVYARHAEMSTLEEVDSFLQDAIENNCEGLMVKTLHTAASYEPSKRSLNWLKIKKDYLEHLTDSVDLVPIGAFHGKGKRTGVFGSYLLACYYPDEEAYQTVCKTATGFSEELLQTLHDQLSPHITLTKDASYHVDDRLIPDVWFRPAAVWEIRAADLSLSPIHTGGIGLRHSTKGIGLRFPRFLRVRDDKTPELATTALQIVEMYDAQFTHQPNAVAAAAAATVRPELEDEEEDSSDDAQ